MIEKIIPGDSQEALIKTAGRLIQVYESFKHIKQAASRVFSRQELESYAPPKGKFMSHAITLGAYDRYGMNRNRDGWTDRELRGRHSTFETNARNYREHDNDDPKKAVGEVKAAKYDPELQRGEIVFWTDIDKAASEFERARRGEEQHGSMACFPGDTPVLMADGSEKPIADIAVGDLVVTHRGNVGTVSRTMRREYADKGVRIKSIGLPDLLLATAEHPVWVRPAPAGVHECPVCGGIFKNLQAHAWQKKDPQHVSLRLDFGKAAEGWKRADQLVPGDMVRTPFSKKVTAGGSECYAILLGWYAAEGNVFDSEKYTECHWCTDFTLSIKEEVYVQEINQALLDYGIEPRQISIYREPKVGRTRIRCRNVDLMRRLIKDVGKYSWGKRFSTEIMLWEPKIQRIIVSRMFEGDGTWHKQGESLVLGTVSRSLAWQAAEMLWRCDIAASIHQSCPAKEFIRERLVDGKLKAYLSKKRRAYGVAIPSRDIGKVGVRKAPPDYQQVLDHSPRSIGHLKHQAACAVSKERAPTPVRMWIEDNFVYRRVSEVSTVLIEEPVYDLTVPGDHGFVVLGVGVSNCSVDHDLCSCCGFKSKTAAERCDHIRFEAGNFLPAFQKYAYMDNIGSTFKDYSWVRRPADRIAHTLSYLMPLSKAASADRQPRGDELAAFYRNRNTNWRTELLKLAEFDRPDHEHPAKRAAASHLLPRAFSGEFDSELLEKMSSHPYPGRVMRSMIDRQMVMPLASFNSWITGVSLAASRCDPVVKEASEKLADMRIILINRMEGEPELAEAFGQAAGQFEPMSDCCGDIVDSFMDKARDQFSLRYEALSKRAAYNPASISRPASGLPPGEQAFGLAALYNAYLVKTASLIGGDWMTAALLSALR